jgi:hypothetical protein
VTAAATFKGVQVAPWLFGFDPKHAHFGLAFAAEQERLDWVKSLGHARHHALYADE